MKKYLPKSEYARNSIISVVGVGLAAIIPLLLRPFLGRIFTPAEFNILGLYIGITSILAIAANFRYGYAVAICKDDEQAKNVLLGSIVLSFCFSLLIFITVFFFGDAIALALKFDPAISEWFYLIPLSVFFTSSCIGLNGWLNRKKSFTAMAVNKSLRRGGEGFFQFVFGKLKLTGGLIYGTFIGDAINFLIHLFQFKKADGNFRNVNSDTIKKSLAQYVDFPKYNLIPSLLDTVSLYLPFFIVNNFYSKEISGQFFQSRDLLAMPLILVSMALSQVLLQKLTEKRAQSQHVTPIIMRHIYFLSTLAIVGVLILYPFGEDLFVIFVGPQWGVAGNMASLMVIAYAMKFVITPLSVIFFAIEKVKISSFWQLGYFGGMCCLFFFPSLDINTFILYYVIIEVIFYIIYLILILKVSKQYDRNL